MRDPAELLNERAQNVSPFMVMEVLERAQELTRAGRSIIHLEIGEPDFPTSEPIVRAMNQALAQNSFYYTHSQGDPELREALARHYRRRYGLDLDPRRFLVTPGTSAGFMLLFGALLSAGDGVVISDPHYCCYPNFIKFFGGKVILCPALEEDGFRLDPRRAARCLGPDVKALIINSPANPTGAVLDSGRLAELAGLDTLIIADEIYHGLNYQDDRDHSILEYTDQAVVVGGFSKCFAMTGWRIGYLILPPELVRPFQRIAQNFIISVNAAVQKAAIAALEEDWPRVEERRIIYNRRRKLLVRGLKALGLGILADPEGAFYVLARADHLNPDSAALVYEILEEASVGTVPGREFGSRAEGFLRFSYAAGEEDIEKALARLAVFIRNREERNRGERTR
ncbi:MAG: pyridoxal phosphate-dependent aminotransferase [Deltaproteobacteria bacterium]|jgi:aspartate/methionine/tyrosine aminotransferase|nr:pyridoxal phosphate-dependent aminotransferase [Deltaproteobacteria bacterium]